MKGEEGRGETGGGYHCEEPSFGGEKVDDGFIVDFYEEEESPATGEQERITDERDCDFNATSSCFHCLHL